MIPDSLHDPILLAFLNGHPITQIAAHYKVAVLELTRWLKSPLVADLLRDLEDLAHRQAALATAQARIAAIQTLESAVRGREISDTEFRAASTLLRNTPKAPPAAARPIASSDEHRRAAAREQRAPQGRPTQSEDHPPADHATHVADEPSDQHRSPTASQSSDRPDRAAAAAVNHDISPDANLEARPRADQQPRRPAN